MVLTYMNKHGDGVSDIIMREILGPERDRQDYINLCSATGETLLRQIPSGGSGRMVLVDIEGNNLPSGLGFECVVEDAVDSIHPVFSDQYDCAVCLDGIEHVSKERGRHLKLRMERLAPRRIIWTPFRLGAALDADDSDDPHSHKSEWEPEDFPGYACVVFPDYHQPTWSGGGFWAWSSPLVADEYASLRRRLAALWGPAHEDLNTISSGEPPHSRSGRCV